MPFTFAHIGFVLPIKKKWTTNMSVTGLIFGSIAPDYDILFRFTKIRTHIFQYDVKTILILIFPLALISAFFFHVFCRNIIIDNLPEKYEIKYQKYKSFSFFNHFKTYYFSVSVSILFAILLHLFLDFLCHCLNAYYLKMFIMQLTQNELLANFSYFFGIYGLPVLFSLVGFYLIYVYEFHRNISIKSLLLTKSKFIFWMALLLFTIVFCIIKFYITEVDNEFFFDYIIISITSSFIVAAYATGILFYFINKLKTQ